MCRLLRSRIAETNPVRDHLWLPSKSGIAAQQDADLDLAAKNIVKGGYSYSGQRCTAVKLVLAHETIADKLVEKVGSPGGWPLMLVETSSFIVAFTDFNCLNCCLATAATRC
jgi:Aldehyde dehydrogenase family